MTHKAIMRRMRMAKINIKGAIVSDDDKWIYDYFGLNSTCPADIHAAISEAAGADLDVEINSGGGDVIAGNEIYTALRMYKGNVTCMIVGMAASAASYIATARKCVITPVGLYMIHNASGSASGDYHVLDKGSEILQTVNKAITAAYAEKTSMSQEKILELMDKETWLTADEAVAYGFVDSIIENQENRTANQTIGFFNGKNPMVIYNSTQILDRETIERTREMLRLSDNGRNTTPEHIAADSVLIKNMKAEGKEEMDKAQNSNISTVEELVANYPDLVQQIRAAAVAEATNAENERLKAIDDIAAQISDEMVNEAKYGKNRMTAETLAFNAFRRNAVLANETFNSLKQDVKDSGTAGVGSDANAGMADGDSKLNSDDKVQNLANMLKRKQR